MEVLIETIVGKLRRLPTDKLTDILDFVNSLDRQESNGSTETDLAKPTKISKQSMSIDLAGAENKTTHKQTTALSRARAALRKTVPPGYSIADELIEERRQESKYE